MGSLKFEFERRFADFRKIQNVVQLFSDGATYFGAPGNFFGGDLIIILYDDTQLFILFFMQLIYI
jgi:hypothetical protein